MTEKPEQQFDPKLIDLHLGMLSETEAETVQSQLSDDPELAAQNEALAEVFSALNSIKTPATPTSLADRIKSRVSRTTHPRLFVDTSSANVDHDEPAPHGSILQMFTVSTFRDIVAVAAMVVLAVGLGIPGLVNMKDRAQRTVCSANLASIGSAMQMYSKAYDSLPFAGFDEHDAWMPTTDENVQVVPNRRHMYLLFNRQFPVTPNTFICPSQMHVAMTPEQVAHNTDFLGANNVSYAFQNMAGVRPTVRSSASLPLMSDENPLFENGIPLLGYVRTGFDRQNMNSSAHRRAGQNVLLFDGRVIWKTSPNVGINGDNIWTLKNVEVYTGREGPQTAADSHMLK